MSKLPQLLTSLSGVTVTIVSYILALLLVSLTIAVKLITQGEQLTVIFWLNSADVPLKLKLKYLTKPVSLTIICPKLNPTTSVAFPVRLMISLSSTNCADLLKVAFITGAVASGNKPRLTFTSLLLLTSTLVKLLRSEER